jgi:glycosyltransferase involved in cell wall biosynthesis
MDNSRLPGLPKIGVTITAFPVPGGVRSVLREVHSALEGEHDISYFTARVGPNTESYSIHRFGNVLANPNAFPDALFYALAGMWVLWKSHREHKYSVLLAQDGLYTGLFTAIVGKLTRTRVIIMDHGTAVMAMSPEFRQVKLRQQQKRVRRDGLIELLHQMTASWRRRAHMAFLPFVLRVTTKLSPEFLLVGDEVVDVYRTQLGVPASRIKRYTYTVDANRFGPVVGTERRRIRSELGLPADAIVISMVNRLAPEKGLEVAIPAITRAMRDSDRETILAVGGSGPLLSKIDRVVRESGMSDSTRFLGDLSSDEVARLLSVSDIFVYAGTQGTNISAAVLEAMASGCGIVATPVPESNEVLLAEGRGQVVPVSSEEATRNAVFMLIKEDNLRTEAGTRCRSYVKTHHSLVRLRRMLEHV